MENVVSREAFCGGGGGGAMIRFAFALAILSTCCAASELTVSFIGADAVFIERNEVKETRRLGGIGGGGSITWVKLRGTSSAGPIMLQAPQQGPAMRYLNSIKASCEHGGDKVGISGLSTAIASADYFRDYVGQAGLDASWQYWFAFSPSLCETIGARAMHEKTEAYFICAGKPDKFRCVREHSRKQYSAFYFITSEKFADWREVDAEVNAYLDLAVTGSATD